MKTTKMTLPLIVAMLSAISAVAMSFRKLPHYYQFTRVSGLTRTPFAQDYVYHPSGFCRAATATTCLSIWSQNLVPNPGSHPSATSVFIATDSDGEFYSELNR